MSALTPVFNDETQLMGWGESDVQGPWIKLRLLDSEALIPFRGMTKARGDKAGQRLACVLVEIQDDESVKQEPEASGEADDYGDEEETPTQINALAQKIHRDGYLRNPRLWDAIAHEGLYSLKQHDQFIRSLPCLFASGRGRRHRHIKTAWNMPCSGDVCGHHTTSAALPAAGQGAHPNKVPGWYVVPLCWNHHSNWAHGSHSDSATREEKEYLVVLAVRQMAGIAKDIIKAWLGITSLNELTDHLWATWTAAIKLEA